MSSLVWLDSRKISRTCLSQKEEIESDRLLIGDNLSRPEYWNYITRSKMMTLCKAKRYVF